MKRKHAGWHLSAICFPTGGEVKLEERPLVDKEWADDPSARERLAAVIQKGARFTYPDLLGLETPEGMRVFSEVRDHYHRTLTTYRGRITNLQQTQSWKLEDEEMPAGLDQIVKKAGSLVPRGSTEKDYVLELAGLDWQRHGTPATPKWILTLHLTLHPDYEHARPDVVLPKDGMSYHHLSFFPNGETMITEERTMTDDELESTGLKEKMHPVQ